MFSGNEILKILQPFSIELSDKQIAQVKAYLALLLRWNLKMNLTAIRDPEECLRRHFGESMYLGNVMELHGNLLDIGSGAGFPALPLKIIFPALHLVLLEPSAKKRAFLKEVVRVCEMNEIEILPDRLEIYKKMEPSPAADTATFRAVGTLESILEGAIHCVRARGNLCVWTTVDAQKELFKHSDEIQWRKPIPVPMSRQRQIWIGAKVPNGMPHPDGC